MDSWFSFSFPDFAFSFLSILFEGLPFVLLGTVLSGLIDAFLPARVMTRLLPRNPAAAIVMCGGLGMIFPMCECGIVPVIRRLIGKGLPVSCGLAYMLAAPIVNPVVLLSTYAAFRGQNPELMAGMRIGLGFMVAVGVGLAVRGMLPGRILRPHVLASVDEGDATHAAPLSLKEKFKSALRTTTVDFLDVTMYLVIGAGLTSVFNTAVDQSLILPLALNPWLASGTMMGLAGLLSLCSTSDAFIAATFVTFSGAAKQAFMVFGPMMDIKLLFLYSMLFRRRFVLGLAVGLFIAIGLITVKLAGFDF